MFITPEQHEVHIFLRFERSVEIGRLGVYRMLESHPPASHASRALLRRLWRAAAAQDFGSFKLNLTRLGPLEASPTSGGPSQPPACPLRQPPAYGAFQLEPQAALGTRTMLSRCPRRLRTPSRLFRLLCLRFLHAPRGFAGALVFGACIPQVSRGVRTGPGHKKFTSCSCTWRSASFH